MLLFPVSAQEAQTRKMSGTILTQRFEAVPNVSVEIETSEGKLNATSDSEGNFRLSVPAESLSVSFSGKNIEPQTRIFAATDPLEDLQIKINYKIAPVHESVVIEDNTLTPDIETRNSAIYENTLFGRDDQIIQSLAAGINAGQHEGGGKSLEIRRFGFNLDHGGVGGGLKILTDNVQQNQGTQGHGQGYLGSLKSLSPELVRDVSIINGPFSAQYGDFSGLGVVHIRTKEELPEKLTFRLQGGSHNTGRAFLAYSPHFKRADAFLAYEGSSTDGPFISPLRYRRHNLTGNYTYKFSDKQALGFKFNIGVNDFFSSGQIPLDEIAAGNLDRFGFIDPDNGGKVRNGTTSVYFRKELSSGGSFKADAFLGRSLFDLWSNFTFFLADENYGDEIQQHDSRLQEGVSAQFLKPYKLFGNQSLLTIGGNFHANQINVGLSPSINRNPNRKFQPENINFRDANKDGIDDVLLTSARAKVNNYAGYIQNGADFFNGHLHIETGLRFDTFTFDVNGFEFRDAENGTRVLRGRETAARFQPKFGVALSPFEKIPATVYFNYGRGIASQDARGVVRNSDSPRISTTDFYQTGASYNSKRFSIAPSLFFIDRSNEQVYIPDDGSIEFAGRSRSYGVEVRTSARFNKFVSFNGGLTQVIRAFYPGEFIENESNSRRREIVTGAPHTVANGSLVFSGLSGFNFSLNYRHINSYRLDAEDENIRAAGHDVFDFALSKRLRRSIDFNFAIDNLLNKRYYETQNYFESRLRPGDESVSRIHATPGYPFTVSVGFTIRLFAKD
ncbi:MAG TPA: TonB-dependent receptor [Pyrinomonadaceae bacterium]|nr:TonB-dependent receptor [Pyrinomonadaceae bacterium]